MWIRWDVAWLADFDAHFGQEVDGELVTISEMKCFAVKLQLDANVEVFETKETR